MFVPPELPGGPQCPTNSRFREHPLSSANALRLGWGLIEDCLRCGQHAASDVLEWTDQARLLVSANEDALYFRQGAEPVQERQPDRAYARLDVSGYVIEIVTRRHSPALLSAAIPVPQLDPNRRCLALLAAVEMRAGSSETLFDRVMPHGHVNRDVKVRRVRDEAKVNDEADVVTFKNEALRTPSQSEAVWGEARLKHSEQLFSVFS